MTGVYKWLTKIGPKVPPRLARVVSWLAIVLCVVDTIIAPQTWLRISAALIAVAWLKLIGYLRLVTLRRVLMIDEVIITTLSETTEAMLALVPDDSPEVWPVRASLSTAREMTRSFHTQMNKAVEPMWPKKEKV